MKALIESEALKAKASDFYLAIKSKSKDLIVTLSKSTCSDIRRMVASNYNCPLDVLEDLSCDEDYWVRYNVAYNLNSSNKIIKKLCDDDHFEVSCAAQQRIHDFQ